MRETLSASLLVAASGLALGVPPEVYPESGPLIAFCLALGLALLARGVRLSCVVLGLSLAVFQLGISLAPGATLEQLFSFALAAGGFVLARGLGPVVRHRVLVVFALVGPALGLLAVAQRVWLLKLGAEGAREAGVAQALILRLEHGRPFATHVVPAALAGALLVSAASLAALHASGTRRRWVLLALTPVLAGFLLTASLGGLLGFVLGLAFFLAPFVAGWPRRRIVAILALLVVVGSLLVALRPVPVFDLSRPDNPLVLRLGNWRGAALVYTERPVSGTGLGSFGSLYPALRREGDSETRFAHNSWLQLITEGGIPAAVLLGAAGLALYRRRREEDAATRWLLAAAVAFGAHNLVDFTAYLPGVALPVMTLVGLAFSPRRGPAREGDGLRSDRAGALLLAAVLALCIVPWVGEALSRRALDRAQLHSSGEEPALAVREASAAAVAAPWNTRATIQAGGFLLAAAPGFPEGGGYALARAEDLAHDLIRLDPRSPAPWHLLARAQIRDHRPADAWRSLEMAAIRHPAGTRVRELIEGLEASLGRNGMLGGEFAYGEDSRIRKSKAPWQVWDDLLLLIAAVLSTLVLWRWWRPGPAPAAAFAIALVLILSVFGEGGALPGARLGRSLLVGIALLVTLFPRGARGGRDAWDLGTLIALAPALAWAGISAVVAPASLAVRDGLSSLLCAFALLGLSLMLARQVQPWPRLLVKLFALSAGFAAILWAAQKGSLLAGFDLSAVPVPLRVYNSVRPAADFLHPGHLGTFLVAGGLALLAIATIPRMRKLPLLGAGFLILAGLLGGGRAPVFALLAGGALLLWQLPGRRTRQWVALLLAAGLLLGTGAVVWRFTHGDPGKWTRTKIWSACTGAMLDRPALGFGPGGFAPLAGQYIFEDPQEISHFGKSFRGPHSDLAGLFLALGLPGGVLLLAGLAWLLRSALASRPPGDGEEVADKGAQVAALAALGALAAHGLVDDLFSERPAAWVAAALLLGALVGMAPARWPATALRRSARLAAAVSVLLVVLGAEFLPWAADRAFRAGQPFVAAQFESRAGYHRVMGRSLGGTPRQRFALALDQGQRAISLRPYDDDVWIEQARILESACRGLLGESNTCRAAENAWSAALARAPENVFARRARARLRRALGRTADAENDLRLAIGIEPAFLGARQDLIRLLDERGDHESARRERAAFDAQIASLSGARPISVRDRELLTFP